MTFSSNNLRVPTSTSNKQDDNSLSTSNEQRRLSEMDWDNSINPNSPNQILVPPENDTTHLDPFVVLRDMRVATANGRIECLLHVVASEVDIMLLKAIQATIAEDPVFAVRMVAAQTLLIVPDMWLEHSIKILSQTLRSQSVSKEQPRGSDLTYDYNLDHLKVVCTRILSVLYTRCEGDSRSKVLNIIGGIILNPSNGQGVRVTVFQELETLYIRHGDDRARTEHALAVVCKALLEDSKSHPYLVMESIRICGTVIRRSDFVYLIRERMNDTRIPTVRNCRGEIVESSSLSIGEVAKDALNHLLQN